ncbi:branched-chain amino acid ABC transporter permease [Pseudaminobacter sp. NGMCC 1.201702]|uniref:branched-chain amino acid ABC transporter permease n=1 Tax=Pseudaminobacter sp. NGMCC 1.201702 TaxID=3391825 RepID=UPI0039F063EF
MQLALQQFINALSLGSIYALVALGVAIVFSILRLANFAHGELMTVAGYTLFTALSAGAHWVFAIVAAIAASIVAALVLERVAYRRLRNAQPLTLLMTSFAVSVALQSIFLLTFGARPKGIELPLFVDAALQIGALRVQWLDISIILITGAIVLGLTFFLRKTVIGLALRSAADDFRTTRLMGIKANALFIGAFALSGLLAGVAALFYFATVPNVVPSSGFEPMLKGFIACVIGGLGSLPAAVIGGFLLAFLEVGSEALLSDSFSPYLDAIVFGIAIIILRWRPGGLFGVRLTEEQRV